MTHDPRDPNGDRLTGGAPVFNAPGVVVAFICLLMGVQGLRDLASAQFDLDMLRNLAFVPGRLAAWLAPEAVAEHLRTLLEGDEQDVREAMLARYFLSEGAKPWTLVTYALLHGGWAHVGVNSLWLLAFGSATARRFGAARFAALCGLTALAGAAAHLAFHFTDFAPVVGASGIASGAMGAAARFVFQPGAPLGAALAPGAGEAAYRTPAPPWTSVLRDRRAALFLGVWFVMNFGFGAFAYPLGLSDSPVAWEAHIGGLLAGFFLFDWLDR